MSVMMSCELKIKKLVAHSYPAFEPNDYLFTEYAKTIPDYEKMEKWQIFAHAVRDFMCQEGKFGYAYESMREKIALEKFVEAKTDEITVASGNTYYWPPRGATAKSASEATSTTGESEKDK